MCCPFCYRTYTALGGEAEYLESADEALTIMLKVENVSAYMQPVYRVRDVTRPAMQIYIVDIRVALA